MANMIDYDTKVLQVKNLRKYFRVGAGRRKLLIPAVDGVTFNVHKREVFGVVGESGSGKTTLGRTIIKLYQPTDGSVTLNDVMISAGTMTFLESIKRIKQKLEDDITALNPSKIKSIELKREANAKINRLEQEIAQLKKDLAKEILGITKQFDLFRAEQYRINALKEIDKQKVLFDFNQKVRNIKLSLQNESLLKYKNEIKIANLKLQNKVSGLKDSAALQQTTINERIVNLQQAHQAFLLNLKSAYAPQIEADAKKMLTKTQVQQEISSFNKDKLIRLKEIDALYQKELDKLVAPSKATYADDKAKVQTHFDALINKLNLEIKQIKEQLKTDLSMLPKNTKAFNEDVNIKNNINKLKAEANAKILELKHQLQQAKRVNHSSDTLRESQKMQMIFQDPISSLNPRMTVKEIIGEGLVIQGKLKKKEIEKKVAEVLELVGLSPEYASRYPHEFSGGQRQRIGVARALIMNPNVIIADEPISALDVSIRAQIINLLFNLREKLGLTILFIAHDLSVVRFFCDRIAVMFNGKVVEMASSEELFRNPMHPYTVSLLSAIPQPDPDYEKNRKRINYNPRQHDYRTDFPTLREIGPNHQVLANQAEFEAMKQRYIAPAIESIKKGKGSNEK